MIGFTFKHIERKELADEKGVPVSEIPYGGNAPSNHMGGRHSGRSGTGIPITEYKLENGKTYYEMFPKKR